MKRFRVVLYVGGDKQWIHVWADNEDEASKKAKDEVMVLSCEEDKESEDEEEF